MSQAHDLDRLARELRGGGGLRGSLLLIAIIALLAGAFGWASVTMIDDVTRAEGRVVPSQEVQVVQAAEAGVLKALHVREGQVVGQGTLLMELDRTQLASQFEQERQRATALRLRIARLEAQIEGAETLRLPPDLVGASPTVARSEVALFEARRDEILAEIDVLERQRRQRQQEQQEAQAEADTAAATLGILNEEVAMMRPLVQQRIEPETTLLALRRTLAEWEGRGRRATATLARHQAGLSEIDDRIASLRARAAADAQGERALATAELAELQTRLPALEQRAARSDIRAPVRGVVNQVSLTTIGGVAQAGAALVEIVPIDDSLLVEAYLPPRDIAFLYPGQGVKVKITAYDASRYGSIEGEIARIGANAVVRPGGQDQVFIVEVRTSTNILDAAGAEVEIIPGMTAEVDILAGRKTVLDYITQPIVRVKDRAFRD